MLVSDSEGSGEGVRRKERKGREAGGERGMDTVGGRMEAEGVRI